MNRRKRYVAGFFFVTLTLFSASYWWPQFREQERPPIATGAVDKLMAMSLADIESNQQSLSKWEGTILVINFWATWCPPCREEIPQLVHLATKYSDKNVQFVGIALDSENALREFLRVNSVNFPQFVAFGTVSGLFPQLGNADNGLPYTLVLDEKNLYFGANWDAIRCRISTICYKNLRLGNNR